MTKDNEELALLLHNIENKLETNRKELKYALNSYAMPYPLKGFLWFLFIIGLTIVGIKVSTLIYVDKAEVNQQYELCVERKEQLLQTIDRVQKSIENPYENPSRYR